MDENMIVVTEATQEPKNMEANTFDPDVVEPLVLDLAKKMVCSVCKKLDDYTFIMSKCDHRLCGECKEKVENKTCIKCGSFSSSGVRFDSLTQTIVKSFLALNDGCLKVDLGHILKPMNGNIKETDPKVSDDRESDSSPSKSDDSPMKQENRESKKSPILNESPSKEKTQPERSSDVSSTGENIEAEGEVEENLPKRVGRSKKALLEGKKDKLPAEKKESKRSQKKEEKKDEPEKIDDEEPDKPRARGRAMKVTASKEDEVEEAQSAEQKGTRGRGKKMTASQESIQDKPKEPARKGRSKKVVEETPEEKESDEMESEEASEKPKQPTRKGTRSKKVAAEVPEEKESDDLNSEGMSQEKPKETTRKGGRPRKKVADVPEESDEPESEGMSQEKPKEPTRKGGRSKKKVPEVPEESDEPESEGMSQEKPKETIRKGGRPRKKVAEVHEESDDHEAEAKSQEKPKEAPRKGTRSKKKVPEVHEDSDEQDPEASQEKPKEPTRKGTRSKRVAADNAEEKESDDQDSSPLRRPRRAINAEQSDMGSPKRPVAKKPRIPKSEESSEPQSPKKAAASKGKKTATRASKGIHILTSLLSDEQNELVMKFANEMKVKIEDEFSPDITHLVTDSHQTSDGKIRATRSLKFLRAILLNKWVVTIDWIKDSLEKGEILPEDSYEVEGTTRQDASTLGGPRLSRTTKKKLFEGYNFFLEGKFDLPGAPNKEELEDFITCGGGTILGSQLQVTSALKRKTKPVVVIREANEFGKYRRGCIVVDHNILMNIIGTFRSDLFSQHIE